MRNLAVFFFAAGAAVGVFAIDLKPPVSMNAAAETDEKVAQRRKTAEEFGFMVRAGADMSPNARAWKAARFARLFYVGYALSQCDAQDVRAETMRRSLGSADASWEALWGGAKDLARSSAGNGEGMVNLLFDPIAGLADPEEQYARMLRDKDYLPCAQLVLAGLLANVTATPAVSDASTPSQAEQMDEGASQSGNLASAAQTAGEDGADLAYQNGWWPSDVQAYANRPSDDVLRDPSAAEAYMRQLVDARLADQVSHEFLASEMMRMQSLENARKQRAQAAMSHAAGMQPRQGVRSSKEIEAAIRGMQNYIRETERKLNRASDDYSNYQRTSDALYVRDGRVPSGNVSLSKLKLVQTYETCLSRSQDALEALYRELDEAQARENGQTQSKAPSGGM